MVPTGAAPAGSASQTKAGMPTGPFGGMAHLISPAASPPQAVTPIRSNAEAGPAPSGSTPNAKRPMDRASVDVALTGTRTMSAEDLSAGFLNLQRLQARDETFQSNVAGAVQYNADLLNLLVTRVNALEASTVLLNDGL